MMTRAEHLAWAKERALKYVELGDLQGAFLSMASDLGKHPETQNHPGSVLGTGLLMLLESWIRRKRCVNLLKVIINAKG